MAKKRASVPALKIVFDTNALFTELAHYLVSKDVRELIESNSGHQDVRITWHLPEIVVLERTYQMQEKANVLLPHVEKVEKLLNHRLNITDEILKSRVEKVVEEQLSSLGFQMATLDAARVDWKAMWTCAAFRRPPFETQKEGKGFRDALIAETLLQLVEDSPVTESVCRIAFVCNDAALVKAIEERTSERKNVRIVPNLEELKSLINTVVSEIPEKEVSRLAELAKAIFFSKDNLPASAYSTMQIKEQILVAHNTVLTSPPPSATRVAVSGIRIRPTNFVRKVGRTITWSTQVVFELVATKDVVRDPSPPTSLGGLGLGDVRPNWLAGTAPLGVTGGNMFVRSGTVGGTNIGGILSTGAFPSSNTSGILDRPLLAQPETVFSARDTAVFNVEWSCRIGTSGKLTRPTLDAISIASLPWQQSSLQ